MPEVVSFADRVELRVAEGMPAGVDGRGRRVFDVDECRRWLRERAA